MLKFLLKAGAIMLAFFIVFFIASLVHLTWGLKGAGDVDLAGLGGIILEDGGYTGIYEYKRWSNVLNVRVSGGKIIEIKIIDDVDYVDPTVTDALFSKVIEAQDTDIDTITGATATSKSYLKAIENALIGAD